MNEEMKQIVCVKVSFKTMKTATETYDRLKTTVWDKHLRVQMFLCSLINFKMSTNQSMITLGLADLQLQ